MCQGLRRRVCQGASKEIHGAGGSLCVRDGDQESPGVSVRRVCDGCVCGRPWVQQRVHTCARPLEERLVTVTRASVRLRDGRVT